jgi:hypothetical protein
MPLRQLEDQESLIREAKKNYGLHDRRGGIGVKSTGDARRWRFLGGPSLCWGKNKMRCLLENIGRRRTPNDVDRSQIWPCGNVRCQFVVQVRLTISRTYFSSSSR